MYLRWHADNNHDTRYEVNTVFHLGRHCDDDINGWLNSDYALVSS